MRKINLETWPRADHFKFFTTWDYPHFNLCANVDLTAFCSLVKERQYKFTVAVVYILARAANLIPEFRRRIHGEQPVEYEVVHPSMTLLTKDDLFIFCPFDYIEDFTSFHAEAIEKIASIKDHSTLEDNPGDDNRLYMTAIPWVSFTSFMHPLDMYPVDSVPRFAWGKTFEENERIKMPLSVQAHHALMDGIHMGRYYELVQGYFEQSETILGKS